MANESIEQFLRAPGRDLEVLRESEITLAPEDDEFRRDAHRLEIRSFEDLQSLRIILPEVREGAIRDAIAVDDDAAWQQACRLAESGRTDCGCHSRTEDDGNAIGSSGRGGSAGGIVPVYRSLRRQRHPALARVIATELKSRVEPDGPVVKLVYGWTERLNVAKVIEGVPAFKFKDVTIAHNATLALAPAVNVFSCGNLRIHIGGRLRIKGSYVKVNCLSAQGNLA